MKSNSKGKNKSNPVSLQPTKSKTSNKNKEMSSALNSIMSNNAKVSGTSVKNTFRQNTANIKLKTTKNSPEKFLESKEMNFNSPKINLNFLKNNNMDQQKKIDYLETEIQNIKNKILGKRESSQNKINLKYQMNKQSGNKIDILNEKKIQDIVKVESKNKSIKYLEYKCSLLNISKSSLGDENKRISEVVTSPVRIESLLHKYYNVDSNAKKKIKIQKLTQNESRCDTLSTTTYNKEFVKKSFKNDSNTKFKNEIIINDKLQYSIKSTPRKVLNDTDYIINKPINDITNHHSKQSSVNTSKIMISSNNDKNKVKSLNQLNNFIPLLTEFSKKNTPKTTNMVLGKDIKVSDSSIYNNKFNNDALSKKISNIKLYEKLHTNLNNSKVSCINDCPSRYENNNNQSFNIVDLSKNKNLVNCKFNKINNFVSNIKTNTFKTKPNSKSNSRMEEKSDTSRKSFLNVELKSPNYDNVSNNSNPKKINSNYGTVINNKQNNYLNYPSQKNVKSSTNSPKHFSLNFKKETVENKLVCQQNANESRGKINIPKDNDKLSPKKIEMKNSNLNLKLNLNSLNVSKTNKLNNIDEKTGGNHSFDHILNSSTCSGLSTIRESNYYKKESEKLTKYIKQYYSKLGEYPPTNIKFYKYGRVLGKGAFGKVNLCLHVQSGRLVAIKSFNKTLMKNENSKKKIYYETNLMKNIRHNSIAKIYEVFENEKYILIILEYVCGGDLLSFVRKRTKLNEVQSKFIFRQIIEGLQYIHSQYIVHRDIKLDNILIDLSNNIKICDFGVSKQIKKGDIMREQCGTPAYIAPEILRNNGYEGFAVDFWSSGVVLYAMLSGTVPFKASNMSELHKLILKGIYNPIKDISEEASNLLKGLLELDPNKRLNVDQILNHPWLKVNNDNGKSKSKMNLFTNAEKILLTKSNIDYKNAKKDEIMENFTLKNLDTLKDSKNLNIKTKSLILAPFNSSVGDDKFLNSNLITENDAIKFWGKAKELNRNYELNNNGEIDNGILINPIKKESFNNNFLSPISSFQKDKYSHPVSPPVELNEQKISNINSPDSHRNTQKNLANTISGISSSSTFVLDENIVKTIEENGYKRDYLLKCLLMNEINYLTTFYFLLLNAKLE